MKRLCFFLWIIIFLFSCKQQIEIDLPEIEVKPVVNCLFSSDNPFSVSLSLPVSPTDSAYECITSAEVIITGDDGSYYSLAHQDKGIYIDSLIYPKAGIQYTLKVNVPGYKQITASDKIPIAETKPIAYRMEKRFYADPIDGSGSLNNPYYQNLELTLKNDQVTTDYMGVSVVYTWSYRRYENGVFSDTIVRYDRAYIESIDPVFTAEGLDTYYEDSATLLFKDKLFHNKTEKVNVRVYSKSEKYWIHFYSFSPACYKYFFNWITHFYTQSYDFWEVYEPLPMYSNIENGYGIFAGYTMMIYNTFPDSEGGFE